MASRRSASRAAQSRVGRDWRDVPAGAFEGLLEVEQTTPHQTGLVRRAYYAAGVGLVFQETVAGGTELVELVAREG